MRKVCLSALAAACFVGSAVAPALGDHDDGDRDHRDRDRVLRAELKGEREVPVVSTEARGSFRAVINSDETEFTYWLDYQDLEGTVTQAHIHIGQRNVNGGISIWLCGTAALPGPAGTPVCAAPGGDGPEATRTVTAADVIGPVGQGVPAMAFAEVLDNIRDGNAYANVHSSVAGGGEIRGQIKTSRR
jgi:hypothetical protein